ncbi:hypothetical protein BM1_08735 [Bipolaris maydis]|nr:hypothetical protein BM1_08735 [Bipolaris maydis]
MSAPDDTNLKALLLLSKESPLARARESLLRGLPDDELAELVAQMISRDKPRGDLEEIARMMLDVIMRRDAQNDALISLATKNDTAVTTSDREIKANYTSGTQTAHNTSVVSNVSEETIKNNSAPPSRKRPASKQPPSTDQETASTKRAKHGDAVTGNKKISLRNHNLGFMLGQTKQAIEVVYWDPRQKDYSSLALGNVHNHLVNVLVDRFFIDYLPGDIEICASEDFLQSQEDCTSTQLRVNKVFERLVERGRVRVGGLNKLGFFPLPEDLRVGRKLQELEFWVQP